MMTLVLGVSSPDESNAITNQEQLVNHGDLGNIS